MSNATQVITPVTNAFGSTIALGTIVRIAPTNNAATKALANSDANVKGLLGVAQIGANNGVSFLAVLAGDATVQLVTGLTLAQGDPIYVSDAQAGKGTNVVPSLEVKQIGWVKSTVGYSVNQQVTAVVTALGAAAELPTPTPPATLLQDFLGGEGSDPLVLGEIVNVRGGNDFVERADATASITFIGTIGVVAVATISGGETGAIAVAGEAVVFLEAGLTPIAGQKIYVSATTPGRGTNVAPTNIIPIGVIRSTANYGSANQVSATITGIDQRPASSSGPNNFPSPPSENLGSSDGTANLAVLLSVFQANDQTITVPTPVDSLANHGLEHILRLNADASPGVVVNTLIPGGLSNGGGSTAFQPKFFNGKANDFIQMKWDHSIGSWLRILAQLDEFGP
jgi:hypothetical protein